MSPDGPRRGGHIRRSRCSASFELGGWDGPGRSCAVFFTFSFAVLEDVLGLKGLVETPWTPLKWMIGKKTRAWSSRTEHVQSVFSDTYGLTLLVGRRADERIDSTNHAGLRQAPLGLTAF